MRLTFAAITLTLAAATPAAAQVTFTSRSLDARVNATRPDLSDATLTTTATTQVTSGGDGGSRDLDLFTLPILTGTTASSTGNVTLSNVASMPVDLGFSPGNEITATATATGVGTGSFTFTNQFAPETDGFNYAYFYHYPNDAMAIVPFVNPALSAVEIYLAGIGGAGLVDEGGQFLFSLTIPGDFSTHAGYGTTAGSHFLASFNFDDFTVTNDFTYDPIADRTTFAAQDLRYDYTDDPANQPPLGFDVFFFANAVTAVPEPATWATMIAGFALIGAALRRRRPAGALFPPRAAPARA